jgi:hypothetical protein
VPHEQRPLIAQGLFAGRIGEDQTPGRVADHNRRRDARKGRQRRFGAPARALQGFPNHEGPPQMRGKPPHQHHLVGRDRVTLLRCHKADRDQLLGHVGDQRRAAVAQAVWRDPIAMKA